MSDDQNNDQNNDQKSIAVPDNEATARRNKLGLELEHMETMLAPHGLSIVVLLRSVAQNFHGVTVPAYAPEKEV